MRFEAWIYLRSSARWTHLHREVELSALPRIGEFIKFDVSNQDDAPFKVVEVTHREGQDPVVMTDAFPVPEEEDFDEMIDDFAAAGWNTTKVVMRKHRFVRCSDPTQPPDRD